jgi:hypothetical protein
MRTCISCKKKADKSSLLRIVRFRLSNDTKQLNSKVRVAFDASGKTDGRGAYVCSFECFEKARKSGRISHALKCYVSKDDLDNISVQLKNRTLGI